MSAALIPAHLVPAARTDADWAFDLTFEGEDWTGCGVSAVFARQGLPRHAFELTVGNGIAAPSAEVACALRVDYDPDGDAGPFAGGTPGTYSVEVRRIDGEAVDAAAAFEVRLDRGLSHLAAGETTPTPTGSAASGSVAVRGPDRTTVVRGGAGPVGPAPTAEAIAAVVDPALAAGFETYEGALAALEARLTVPLADLALSNDYISPTAPAGTTIGSLLGKTHGSKLTLSPNDGRVVLTGDDHHGWSLVTGPAASGAGRIPVVVTETLLAGRNSPKSNSLPIKVVDPLPALAPGGLAFAATRMNLPFGLNGSASSGNRFALSNTYFGAPHWTATGWRFAFPNLYVAGAAGPERSPNTPLTIEFATVTSDAVGAQAWPVTFNGGAQSVVIAPGEIVLSDEVAGFAPAADGEAWIRVQKSVPVGGNLLVGYYHQTQGSDLGEGNENTSAAQTGKRLAGAIGATPGAGQTYGPCFAVARGWDGSPVFLINGTSRQVPTSDVAYRRATRGVTGAPQRGLDSPVGGRMAYGNLSAAGAEARYSASEAAGEFKARMAVLRAVGNAPFNRIVTDIGVNDINGPAPQALETIEANTVAWWTFWRDHCPTVPIYHLFGEPWAPTALNGTFWSTVADQVPAATAAWPDGVQPQWFDWLLHGAERPAWVTPIDLRSVYEEPGSPGRWKVPSPAITGSLLAGVAVNALSVAASLPVMVEPGTGLAVDAESIFLSGSSGTPTNQTLLNHGRFTAAHAAGAVVRATHVRDGVHPAAPLMIAAGRRIETLKADGTIH